MRLYNNFAGVPSGAQLTTANSGGTGQSALDSALSGTGASMLSSTAQQIHGRNSLALATTATASSNQFGWNTVSVGTVTTSYVGGYLYLPANPTANLTIARLTLANVLVGSVVLLTTGKLRVTDSAGAAIATTAAAVNLNAWSRWAVKFTHSTTTGQGTLRLFQGASLESTTPTEEVASATTVNTGTGTDQVRYGHTNPVANQAAFYMADVEMNDTGWPAPIGSNITPTANAGPDQTVEPWSTVTLDGRGSSDPDGTIASYAWSQVAGESVTLVGSGAQPTFQAPAVAGGTLVTLRLQVTDNAGAVSSPDDVSVTVLSPSYYSLVSGSWRPLRLTQI